MASKRELELENDLIFKIKKARFDDEPKHQVLSPHEAKALELQNQKLSEAFEKGLIEVAKEREKINTETIEYPNVVKKDKITMPPEPEIKPMTVQEAKRLQKLDEKLREDFAKVQKKDEIDRMQREKSFEPITKAIREQAVKERRAESSANDAKQKRLQALRTVTRQKRITLEPFRPRALSTPGRSAIDTPLPDDDNEDSMEVTLDQTTNRPRALSTPGKDSTTLPLPEEDTINQSMQSYTENKGSVMGPISRKYLPEARDGVFGIWFDLEEQVLKIGHSTVSLSSDDIILNKEGQRYKGTQGLWELLTKSGAVDEGLYTPEDREAYKDILIQTDSLYQNNDVTTGRPKSSAGQKWRTLVKHIWDEYRLEQMRAEVFPAGSGLKNYNEDPIEYKYIGNLKELIDRLLYIRAQEDAGNNNFHNEKLSVVKFINDRMEELITRPNGLKYVIRCLSALPEHIMHGSGLLNDIINGLPFELHAPGYRFMGPGTKLEKRLSRGDRGVNPLDEAAREHDIWYSKHKRAEDRWEADKRLENKAFERVVARDADIPERLWGLAAGSAMWAKRKLGMGLTTSGYVYPAP